MSKIFETEELKDTAYHIWYGVAWSFQTLRLASIYQLKFEKLSDGEAQSLLDHLLQNTQNIGEVPATMREWFDSNYNMEALFEDFRAGKL